MFKKLIIIAMLAVLFLAVQSGMAMAGATNAHPEWRLLGRHDGIGT